MSLLTHLPAAVRFAHKKGFRLSLREGHLSICKASGGKIFHRLITYNHLEHADQNPAILAMEEIEAELVKEISL